MDKYVISGIQQVGIGVENFVEAWSYYIDVFNMDIKILEDDTVAELMLPYTGNKPQKRHACIAINMQGGGGFEIWQYSERKPQRIDFEIQVGDLGVFVAKIRSRNVTKAYEQFKREARVKILGGLSKSIDEKQTFYVQDPYGNVFQIIQDETIFMDEGKLTSGIAGVMIGVTDIERAMPVYRDILGYDEIVKDETGVFEDFAGLPSGKEKFRRRLLTHSKPRKGGLSNLLGKSYIELVEPLERTPRKIYEGRFWGDPGFIQVCFDVKNLDALEAKCQSLGFPFTVDSRVKFSQGESFDMGEAAGLFTYIEDPDGTLIEFVETHKVPIVKKLGWSLNLKKRNPEKPLPNWLLKLFRFMKIKPEQL